MANKKYIPLQEQKLQWLRITKAINFLNEKADGTSQEYCNWREFISICWLAEIPLLETIALAKDYKQETDIINIYGELDDEEMYSEDLIDWSKGI